MNHEGRTNEENANKDRMVHPNVKQKVAYQVTPLDESPCECVRSDA